MEGWGFITDPQRTWGSMVRILHSMDRGGCGCTDREAVMDEEPRVKQHCPKPSDFARLAADLVASGACKPRNALAVASTRAQPDWFHDVVYAENWPDNACPGDVDERVNSLLAAAGRLEARGL